MKQVLLIGNGISRLSYEKEILDFPGERWAANRAYMDFGPILDMLSGHTDVMIDARSYREENNLHYRIIGGHIEKESISDTAFTCPPRFLRDTGTALLAEALQRKYTVYVVGYDMGGPDVYSANHHIVNKSFWVGRWREIIRYYGYGNIHFIGHDHLPFLLSEKPAHEYCEDYMAGRNHIQDPEYKRVFKKWVKSGRVSKIFELRLSRLWNIGDRVFNNLAQSGKEVYPNTYIEVPDGTAEWWQERYPRDLRVQKFIDGENRMEKTKIYNKGKREWSIQDSDGAHVVRSGKTVEIDSPVAEIYAKNYPQEFMIGDAVGKAAADNSEKLKKQITALEAKIAELEKALKDAVEANAMQEDTIKDLNAAIKKLKKET